MPAIMPLISLYVFSPFPVRAHMFSLCALDHPVPAGPTSPADPLSSRISSVRIAASIHSSVSWLISVPGYRPISWEVCLWSDPWFALPPAPKFGILTSGRSPACAFPVVVSSYHSLTCPSSPMMIGLSWLWVSFHSSLSSASTPSSSDASIAISYSSHTRDWS